MTLTERLSDLLSVSKPSSSAWLRTVTAVVVDVTRCSGVSPAFIHSLVCHVMCQQQSVCVARVFSSQLLQSQPR